MDKAIPWNLEIAAAVVYIATWWILCFAVWHCFERRSERKKHLVISPELQLDDEQLELRKFENRLAFWATVLGLAMSIFVTEILWYKARGII